MIVASVTNTGLVHITVGVGNTLVTVSEVIFASFVHFFTFTEEKNTKEIVAESYIFFLYNIKANELLNETMICVFLKSMEQCSICV